MKSEKKNASLAEHFVFFRNVFDKFNSTGAQMLDSICHMILKLLLNRVFASTTLRICLIIYATLLHERNIHEISIQLILAPKWRYLLIFMIGILYRRD